MKKIIFLGSKPIGYQCLDFLLKNKIKLGIEIVAVFSNDNTRFGADFSVKNLALQNAIPFYEEALSLQYLEKVDLLVSVQYHQLLKKEQIEKGKLAVNLHMAPLPEYRGCNQFTFAILNKEKEFGTTLHIIDKKIDHGAIIAEKKFPIPTNCDVKQLYDLTFQKSLELFTENIQDIINQNITIIEKPSSTKSYLYFRKDINGLKELNPEWESEKIDRYKRALSMPGFEPPYFLEDGEKRYV